MGSMGRSAGTVAGGSTSERRGARNTGGVFRKGGSAKRAGQSTAMGRIIRKCASVRKGGCNKIAQKASHELFVFVILVMVSPVCHLSGGRMSVPHKAMRIRSANDRLRAADLWRTRISHTSPVSEVS